MVHEGTEDVIDSAIRGIRKACMRPLGENRCLDMDIVREMVLRRLECFSEITGKTYILDESSLGYDPETEEVFYSFYIDSHLDLRIL